MTHKRFLTLALGAFLFGTGAHAQLLRLHIADAHTRDNTSVTWSPDYDKLDDEMLDMTDDGNGNYTFDADMPEQFNWMYLEVFGSNRPLVVEKGKTIEVTVTGGSNPSYNITGENRDASTYLKRLDMATAYADNMSSSAAASTAEKTARINKLDATIAQLKTQLQKVAPTAAQQFVGRITDMYEVHYKLEIIGGHEYENAMYNTGSADYDKVLAEVKINDPVFVRYRLNERYIRNQMTKDDYGDGSDLTAYGVKFIEKMKAAGITNATVKHSLLDHLASLVLYQSHPKDVAPFWNAVKEYAGDDKVLMSKYSGQSEKVQAYGDDGDF